MLKFEFRGKSGVEHSIELSDPRLAAIVRRMQDLPGEELFQYLDDAGETRAVESADVNAYLKETAGEEFTSKDYRTWAGTLLALRALRRAKADSPAEAKRNVVRAVESVARRLGNTKAVCRKCYIHPAVLESYLAGNLVQATRGKRSAEAAVIALLERHAQREARRRESSGADGRSFAPLLRKSLAIAARAARARAGAPAYARR
jgi:DNA topoisomerase-1